LLYELLTGQTPFDPKELLASGLDKMRQTIREKEPECPSTRLSTMLSADLTSTASHHRTDAPKLIHLLRGDLDWIVMKTLDKDRTRRYETANALAMDIQRHLDNEPVRQAARQHLPIPKARPEEQNDFRRRRGGCAGPRHRAGLVLCCSFVRGGSPTRGGSREGTGSTAAAAEMELKSGEKLARAGLLFKPRTI
jgi:serine/threonine protein kinase